MAFEDYFLYFLFWVQLIDQNFLHDDACDPYDYVGDHRVGDHVRLRSENRKQFFL
jgi:hypothetical protein